MKRFKFFSIALYAIIALQLNAQVSFNIKVYLEGPFNGTEMTSDLNSASLIPLTQPYSVSPWNYPGTEQVSLIPNAEIVDWVLIELRETTGVPSTATPDKMINRQAAFLKKDGEVAGMDGISLITYSGMITSNLYIIIWHRNHLAMMSSGALTNIGGIYSWDFTDQLTKAYLEGQKEIGTGQYGMIGGDSFANDTIQLTDRDPLWDMEAGKQSYSAVDLNLDSQINNQDKDNIWLINLGLYAQLPAALPFTCGNPLLDTRDGQAYNTVLIDSQCWMAENLNIGTMIPGNSYMLDNGIIEKYCYNNNTANCEIYGGLYSWNEMMQYQLTPGVKGICPDGWHLPTDVEFCTLTQYIDPTVDCNLIGWSGTDAGTKMKSTTGWYDGGNGTNLSGFTALPAGYCGFYGAFTDITIAATIWTSSHISNTGWYRAVNYSNTTVRRNTVVKTFGLSVRCVKD
jgi:uncharacterized protein (TIGR02145 family)